MTAQTKIPTTTGTDGGEDARIKARRIADVVAIRRALKKVQREMRNLPREEIVIADEKTGNQILTKSFRYIKGVALRLDYRPKNVVAAQTYF